MQIRSDNPGALRKLASNIDQLADLVGKVGWFSSAKYEDGTPVAYVASIQELGSVKGNIPPRLGMRATSIEKRQSWAELSAHLARRILAGTSTGKQAMETLTIVAEGDVSKHIAEVVAPPLSPITLELRAMKKRNPGLVITARTVGIAAAKVREPDYETPDVSTKPLNWTGHLIATLTHVVEKA